MTFPIKRVLALLALCLFAVIPVRAQFTPIPQPDAGYLSATTLLSITDPDFTSLSSLADSAFMVSFSTDLVALTVPSTWGAWGAPPDTEGTTPRVLWTNGFTDLTLTLSKPAGLFGFEAQPNTVTVSTLIATFFDGATQVGQITIDVDGNGAARLFAAQTDTFFNRVTLSGTDDFAIAQIRYGNLQTTPEPASLALLLGVALPGTAVFVRRRK